MTQPLTKSHFALLLDQLWRQPDERSTLAATLSRGFTTSDWLLLAGWDTAATLGPTFGKLVLTESHGIIVTDLADRVLINAILIGRGNTAGRECLITSQGTDLGVLIEDSSIESPVTQSAHDPAVLLIAAQFIRDHLDSTLLRPQVLRDIEIAQIASSLNLGIDYFRRLASWFSALAPYL